MNDTVTIELSNDPEKLDLIMRDQSFGFRLVAAARRGNSGPVHAEGKNGGKVEVGRIIHG